VPSWHVGKAADGDIFDISAIAPNEPRAYGKAVGRSTVSSRLRRAADHRGGSIRRNADGPTPL